MDFGYSGWSYDLLAPEEQALVRWLTVCEGAGADVLDGLVTLVEASLLLGEEGAGGAG